MRKYTTLPFKEEFVANGRFSASRGTIKYIVIHTMIGTTQSAINLFGNPPSPGKETSAHYGVSYNGQITAWLEEYYTAFHCGNFALNMESIGIEHEDMGKYTDPRPDTLYDSSAKLVADICREYNIPCDRTRIRKHNEIVATGCPHNLDIDRIIRQANNILNPVVTPPPPVTDPCQIYKDDLSFKNRIIGERDIEIESLKREVLNYIGEVEKLKKQIADMPVGEDCSLYVAKIKQAKEILYGKGFWWTKLSNLKVLFPK